VTQVTREDSIGHVFDVLTYNNTLDINGRAIKATVSHTDTVYGNHVVLYQYTKLCL
jgi:hypothetical protein